MKQLSWFINKAFLPFILGAVFCISLSALFSIFHINYLLGSVDDNLLFLSLPKPLLPRPFSDLVPFSLFFVGFYHLYNFAKNLDMKKIFLIQFLGGFATYLLLNTFLNPLVSLGLCILLPFVFMDIQDRRLGLFRDPLATLASPFRVPGWAPGYLFGFGLVYGFIVVLPYALILLGIPYIVIYLLCLFDEEL